MEERRVMMSLGEKLFHLRKQAGMSQEEVSDKLNVSRQTVSKWETDQTVPELHKAKLLCKLYNVSYAYLVGDSEVCQDLTDVELIVDEIDWTSAWSKKYPILETYAQTKGIETYQKKVDALYDELMEAFGLSAQDTALVYKDMLYQKYKTFKSK